MRTEPSTGCHRQEARNAPGSTRRRRAGRRASLRHVTRAQAGADRAPVKAGGGTFGGPAGGRTVRAGSSPRTRPCAGAKPVRPCTGPGRRAPLYRSPRRPRTARRGRGAPLPAPLRAGRAGLARFLLENGRGGLRAVSRQPDRHLVSSSAWRLAPSPPSGDARRPFWPVSATARARAAETRAPRTSPPRARPRPAPRRPPWPSPGPRESPRPAPRRDRRRGPRSPPACRGSTSP